MRRTIPYAVAVVATIVAVLAVMVGVGIGAPETVEGGSPSKVITNTEPEYCGEGVDVNGAGIMDTGVVLDEQSDLLLQFTAEYSGIDPRTELLLSFWVWNEDGPYTNTPFDWGFVGNATKTHSTANIMWSFGDLPSDAYSVEVGAWVDPVTGPLGGGHPSATLENCALTAFVIPAA